MKTCLYNFDLLKPHFYTLKVGFTGYTLFFLFLLKNIECGYSLEPPHRGGSNEYPQSMKNIRIFLSKNFHFLLVKFSVYLNRHVFEMAQIRKQTCADWSEALLQWRTFSPWYCSFFFCFFLFCFLFFCFFDNPFIPSRLFYLNSLDRSISYLKGAWLLIIIVL